MVELGQLTDRMKGVYNSRSTNDGWSKGTRQPHHVIAVRRRPRVPTLHLSSVTLAHFSKELIPASRLPHAKFALRPMLLAVILSPPKWSRTQFHGWSRIQCRRERLLIQNANAGSTAFHSMNMEALWTVPHLS